MQQTQKISTPQLQDLLMKADNYNGCSFAGISSLTDVKLTGGKKNPMQGRVQKLNIGQLVMVFNTKNSLAYENMVKKRLVEEGRKPEDFVLSDTWFNHIEGTPLIAKKTDIACVFLQVIYAQKAENLMEWCKDNGIEVKIEDADVFEECIKSYQSIKRSEITYLLDGQPIEKKDVVGLPVTQSEGKQGNLSNEMKVYTRTFKMESIIALNIGGSKYIVE